jgi:hypothetical protein
MLSCDANSAYKLQDADHLVEFDAFDLLMIEQPLWHDDFYYHSMLQKRLETPICLDESIRNRRDALAAIEMESCKIINIKLGRVGGFSEAIAVHNAAQERGIPVWCGGMLESGIGRSHNIALSTLENFSLPGDVSASARYWREDIVEPEITVSSAARSPFRIRRAAATRCAPTWSSADRAQGSRFERLSWWDKAAEAFNQRPLAFAAADSLLLAYNGHDLRCAGFVRARPVVER